MNKIIATAVLAAAVVLAPSAASAAPDHRADHGKHHKTGKAGKSTLKRKPCKVVEMTPAQAASAWVPISLGLFCPVIVQP